MDGRCDSYTKNIPRKTSPFKMEIWNFQLRDGHLKIYSFLTMKVFNIVDLLKMAFKSKQRMYTKSIQKPMC